jgi:hypothetical protein
MLTDLQLKNFALANPHLVMQKASVRHPDLFVVKYKNKVFYDNLWTPELKEMRGLVVDKDWNVIVRPFSKVFNRFENGTDILPDEEVVAVRKINGFLGCITLHKTHGIIVSTTGSLDSDFVKLAEKHLLPLYNSQWEYDTTYMFEIVDPTDPHIIREFEGAYLIGARIVSAGCSYTESELDAMHYMRRASRPDWFRTNFGKIVEMTQRCRHEGFMVYGKTTTLKIKSPYYLVKKLFSRVNPEKIDDKWLNTAKTWIDEEYYPLVEHIRAHKDEFVQLTPEARREFMEDFIGTGL